MTTNYIPPYYTAMTAAERKSDLKLTTDTPYLALTGQLWCVYFGIWEKIDHVITAPHYIYIITCIQDIHIHIYVPFENYIDRLGYSCMHIPARMKSFYDRSQTHIWTPGLGANTHKNRE